MRNLVKINNQEIIVKEYQGNRVVTLKDVDLVHQRAEGTARKRFNDNKNRFIEGEDYFVRNSDEAKKEFNMIAPNGIILLTESGYLMLVKSLNDELAWQVQRQLVKSYFRVINTIPKEKPNNIKEQEVEARLRNARVRESNQYLKIAAQIGIPEYKYILQSKAAETLAGKPILPMQEAERKTYSAGDIGRKFGVTKNMIGKVANANGLKTPEYGKLFYSKSEHSVKEVETWRYYDNAIPVFAKLLGKEVA